MLHVFRPCSPRNQPHNTPSRIPYKSGAPPSSRSSRTCNPFPLGLWKPFPFRFWWTLVLFLHELCQIHIPFLQKFVGFPSPINTNLCAANKSPSPTIKSPTSTHHHNSPLIHPHNPSCAATKEGEEGRNLEPCLPFKTLDCWSVSRCILSLFSMFNLSYLCLIANMRN